MEVTETIIQDCFPNITIPQGAIIISAYLKIYSKGVDSHNCCTKNIRSILQAIANRKVH